MMVDFIHCLSQVLEGPLLNKNTLVSPALIFIMSRKCCRLQKIIRETWSLHVTKIRWLWALAYAKWHYIMIIEWSNSGLVSAHCYGRRKERPDQRRNRPVGLASLQALASQLRASLRWLSNCRFSPFDSILL